MAPTFLWLLSGVIAGICSGHLLFYDEGGVYTTFLDSALMSVVTLNLVAMGFDFALVAAAIRGPRWRIGRTLMHCLVVGSAIGMELWRLMGKEEEEEKNTHRQRRYPWVLPFKAFS